MHFGKDVCFSKHYVLLFFLNCIGVLSLPSTMKTKGSIIYITQVSLKKSTSVAMVGTTDGELELVLCERVE